MRRDGPSDKTILRRARQGDRQAFLALLRRYDPRLRRLALRLLADPSRLERVLNRAYLKAWRSIPFLKRSEPAAGWLYRVVYNTCINEMRWEPARPAPPAPDGAPVPLPAASVERRLQGLRALRPAERIPLVLVDGEGLSLEAAARMMRRESAEVARDLTCARGRWRAFVSGEPEPLPDPVVPAELANGAERRKAGVPLAPSPAATMAKLAALAAPTAPREPGGHVKLLASTPGRSGPPAVAAKPPAPRRPRDAEPGVDGTSAGSTSGAAPVAAKPPADPAGTPPDTGGASVPGGGAGARRKRRRDAKRTSRPRPRGGQVSGVTRPETDGDSPPDDRGPG